MQLSCLLLSADDLFAQEGTNPIRRFPQTPEELDEFDVVIFGDVDLSRHWISTAQQQMLVDFVSRRGGGFALIAGLRHAPTSFISTPLERLLPVRIRTALENEDRTESFTGFHPRMTAAGMTDRALRFHRRLRQSRALFDALPPLFWSAPMLDAKPGAEVLLEHPTLQGTVGPLPVVVRGRFGAGRTRI